MYILVCIRYGMRIQLSFVNIISVTSYNAVLHIFVCKNTYTHIHIYPCTIKHDFLHYFVYLTSFDNNRNHSLIEIHASAMKLSQSINDFKSR